MAYRDDVLANDPIVYFEFEETVGTAAADSSPNDNDGTYGAGIVLAQTGVHGNAIRSSNLTNNNWVNVATLDAPTSLDTFQFEAYVKATGYGGGNMRVWENAPPTVSPGDEQIITIGSIHVVFQVKLSGTTFSVLWAHGDAPIDGDWHLLQCAYDGECLGIFWDGVLMAQEPGSGTFNPTLNGPQLVVGNKDDISAGDDAFVGYLEDFAFYPTSILQVCIPDIPPPTPVGGERDELYYDQLGLTELATQEDFCPSFTFVDAAFTMVDGGLTATLPTYDTGDLLVLAYRHSTGSLSGWSEHDSAPSNQFVIASRIADGSEGADVTLPSGIGYPAAIVAWRPFPTMDTTILGNGSAPFGGGTLGTTGYVTDSVSPGDTPGTFPVLAFTQLVDGDGEIDTLSIAIILTDGTWPDYTWNHEVERDRFLDPDSGYAVIVADGTADSSTSSGSPPDAPSLTWGVSTTSIFHGAAQYVCTQFTPPAICEFEPGALINDDFADALEITIAGGEGEFGSGGWPHTPTDGETLIGATKEPGEPDHMGDPGGHSIWFKFVADTTGPWFVYALTAESDDAPTSPLLAVYTGASVGALTEVTYDTPPASDTITGACGDQWETYGEITSLTMGTTYYVAVDGADGIPIKAVYVQVGTI